MIFRTPLPALHSPWHISHQHKLMAVGSCFTENIGTYLQAQKFQININPFGIIYNPISIADNLIRLANNNPFDTNDLIENAGLWHSWSHHGCFATASATATLTTINHAFDATRNHLTDVSYLIITLGTASIFTHRPTQRIVANCHKIPNHQFDRTLLSVTTVTQSLGRTIEILTTHYPQLRIILTVSPVRHLRDGFAENQQSKATLLLACAECCNTYSNTSYFPAYELVMDDLRDYRFYAADMIHPNQTAIEYIQAYFSAAYFDANTQQLNKEIAQIVSASHHRPLNPQTPAHQQFLRQQLLRLEVLEQAHPYLDFSTERALFTKQIMT
ncbi:MAG: GSCFA domain-containing protein [Saprospiraceae bacterium]|nr:GSCFA domain-containing protein [Saprospiraceae bacterium]MBP7679673.1 GSCFA domain-containing protein [Saprospiraceae bacterium]